MNELNLGTRENMVTAMHGEAFAYLRYMAFAKLARDNGRIELADLYEAIAGVERNEHFAEQAALVGLIGTDADNLRAAINGESYEVTTMYPSFAQQAESVGDTKAAELFREIGNDEKGHLDALSASPEKLAEVAHSAG